MRIAVAGLSHPNSDGTNRQETLAFCNEGDDLLFSRDPSNPYDFFAIKVCRSNGQQLGFIPRELAKRIGPQMDQGKEITGSIAIITGFDEKGYRRCHIDID